MMAQLTSSLLNPHDDPLAYFLVPPANETASARNARLTAEAEARRISELIDESIIKEKRNKEKKDKKGQELRMLLLGQSESGKSTTLKNMQLAYAPNAWAADRLSWKAVIQLNLIRAVNAILDSIAIELNLPSAPTSPSTTPPPTSIDIDPSGPYFSSRALASSQWPSGASLTSPPSTRPPSPANPTPSTSVPPADQIKLRSLRLRLAPLRPIEIDLKAKLGAGTEEITEASSPLGAAGAAEEIEKGMGGVRRPLCHARELVVKSHGSFKTSLRTSYVETSSTQEFQLDPASNLSDSASDVLAQCSEDIILLWNDPVARNIVRRRKSLEGLGDNAEYFLTNARRITSAGYSPSNDDVLRTRIRTVGVQEYKIAFENGRDMGREWLIYDVGGSRTSRAAWVPYFSEAHAVLFLAPISAFDERLAEDRRVNRLEDSFALWKSVVGAELLKHCVMILFMNKCDVLEQKLQNGSVISRHLTSYGERTNDATTFAKYMKTKFREILTTCSPEKRQFYGYMTSVIDAEATATTISSIRDGILQNHLKAAKLLA